MVYTIGWLWFWSYIALAVVAVCFGWWFFSTEYEKRTIRSLPAGITSLVGALVFVYLAIFAGSHFRVGINERALIVNTIRGEIEGIRGPGVQSRPLLGVTVQNWPANRAYQIFLDMQPGTTSASTANNIALWVDTKLFLDLSELDIEQAYRAVNGDWDVFFQRYLETQLMNIARATSKDFTVVEHNTRREDWAAEFDQRAIAFFANDAEGFGARLVPGMTTMSWDFSSEEDAQAFDTAQRAAFLITQRQNEQAALDIEAEMAVTRAQILVETSRGATDSWQQVVDFIATQPPDIQQFLVAFMSLQGDLEYLRLVGQLQPDVIFPPGGGGPDAVYTTNPVMEPTPQPQPAEPTP